MLYITMIDLLSKQKSALIHLATTCEDEGLAYCIENVAAELDKLVEDLESDGIVFAEEKKKPDLVDLSKRYGFCPAEVERRKVGKIGIRFDGSIYHCKELYDFIGTIVSVLPFDDAGMVAVFDAGGSFICRAIDESMLGRSRAELKIGREISKRISADVDALLQEWRAYQSSKS